jgi:hypothetical protein
MPLPFKSLYNWATKKIADVSTGHSRSPKWRHVEKTFLLTHRVCAACNTSLKLQVHHKMPFHLDATLELNPDNLISLCMDVNECHLHIGHGGNWKSYNPNVVADAEAVLTKAKSMEQVIVEAKSNRVN